MQRVYGVVALVASLVGSGCPFLGSGGSTSGKATFSWSFAGSRDRNQAGVRTVRVFVQTAGGSDVVNPTDVTCDSGAHEVGPLREGEYQLILEGLNADGLADYSVSRTFVILGGDTTNLGTVDLGLLFGVLLVDWQFDVPRIGMSEPTPDCAVAGVVDLVLFLDDSSGNILTTQPQPCNEPIEIADVAPGRYFISMEAYGSYNGNPFLLYEISNHEVDVVNAVLDTGQIVLNRRDQNFGNMNISYTFEGGGTCTSNGVTEVVVDDFQGTIAQSVATFRYACPANMSTLTLTVPGDHRVEMHATGMSMGSAVSWTGSTTTNVAPGQSQNVAVTLRR